MVYKVLIAPRVVKYLKKLQDQQLKSKFVTTIYQAIASDPYSGHKKRGDLRSYFTTGFIYRGTTYRIAYTINSDNQISDNQIVVVLAGTHENFYQQLKRFC